MSYETGFDSDESVFTLKSRSTASNLTHVETFTDVKALDYKVVQLEINGHEVSIAPAIGKELSRA